MGARQVYPREAKANEQPPPHDHGVDLASKHAEGQGSRKADVESMQRSVSGTMSNGRREEARALSQGLMFVDTRDIHSRLRGAECSAVVLDRHVLWL